MQVVIIFGGNQRADRYAAVKKLCCGEKPIASQVSQISNALLSICNCFKHYTHFFFITGFVAKNPFKRETAAISCPESCPANKLQTWWRSVGNLYSHTGIYMQNPVRCPWWTEITPYSLGLDGDRDRLLQGREWQWWRSGHRCRFVCQRNLQPILLKRLLSFEQDWQLPSSDWQM